MSYLNGRYAGAPLGGGQIKWWNDHSYKFTDGHLAKKEKHYKSDIFKDIKLKLSVVFAENDAQRILNSNKKKSKNAI